MQHSVDNNMWVQVKGVRDKIQSLFDTSPNGVDMICFSQGLEGGCSIDNILWATFSVVASWTSADSFYDPNKPMVTLAWACKAMPRESIQYSILACVLVL